MTINHSIFIVGPKDPSKVMGRPLVATGRATSLDGMYVWQCFQSARHTQRRQKGMAWLKQGATNKIIIIEIKNT